MEIKYKRTYTPARGKRYTVGEISAMLGYALELAEPRLKLKEGKLAPGETAMLLFGITPDEYALKDGDPKAMDALAERLQKHVPADRLMGWRILDLKGALVQRVIQPETGESIDGGEFIRLLKEKTEKAQAGPIDAPMRESRRLQLLAARKDAPEELKQEWQAARRELGAALMGLEQVWVAYDALSNDRWPSVGFDGRIEIFTTAERARHVQGQITNVHAGVPIWSLRVLKKAELITMLQGCAGDGLDLLRIDNGFIAAELTVKDCCMHALEDNAALRSMLLREIQYGMRYSRFKELQAPERNQRGALESMLTMRGFAWRTIGNGALWALCTGGMRDKCVVLSGKDGGEKLLAAFTNHKRAQEFAQKLNPAIRPVEMKFDELAQRCDQAEGLLIDYGFIGYRMLRSDFEKVVDVRAKPPVIVRVKDGEGDQAAPRPEAPKRESSLPNPDDYDLPAKPEADPRPPQNDPPQDDPDPKGGGKVSFLKKFFKK